MQHDEKRQHAMRELHVHRRRKHVGVAAAERESLARDRGARILGREPAHHHREQRHRRAASAPRLVVRATRRRAARSRRPALRRE